MTKEYLLLRWKDGVQEVAPTVMKSPRLLRYYVLARVEEYGRLAIAGEGKYADLIVLNRKPRELESVVFFKNGASREYRLIASEEQQQEGDRVETLFDSVKTEGMLDSLATKVEEILRSKGTTPNAILEMSGREKEAELEELRKALNLRALSQEEHVLEFIEILLSRMGTTCNRPFQGGC